ncbi:GNAT family N-acetyltransferase [Mucilaginibacter sp. L3T2-6]|uniref:GNAT family N-acetyltransferase n=1 Tax=Mucilaginibacter sp. L3T2-6 TaxID=3062491 RepID=UPI0026F611DE|nr:GNAT family N-acetyltransferase [Mucilaginibacter sp. L3T2-6]MDO3641589.1 GNAT family N-acetyltransferase [Mucilaginibacter sp. L3T2-6]
MHFQAGQDVRKKLCVVFAMTDGAQILGYYSLSNASVPAEALPDDIRKKMPKSYSQLPVTLLGRLAVDNAQKGKGFGKVLLIDALNRSYKAADSAIGSIGVVVDPLDVEAHSFYKSFGFIALEDSEKMFLPMKTISLLIDRLD